MKTKKEAIIQASSLKIPTSCRGILFLGDVHEEEDSLEEIHGIFKEVIDIAKQNDCNYFFQLGDLCDKNRLEANELYHMVSHIDMLNKSFDFVGVIEGNHDKKEKEVAIINFLSFLGVKIFSDEVLIDVPFVKFNKLLLGHWFVDKSKDAFGTHHKYTVDQLINKYDFKVCLLGHQHDRQTIEAGAKKVIIHLGSARFVAFGEKSKNKYCAVLNDKGFSFIPLKSPIPIYNIDNISDLKKVPERAKVRYIFKSFAKFKDELEVVNKLKDRFHEFKKKLDFSVDTDNSKLVAGETKGKSESEIISSWLDTIIDPDLKKVLSEYFTQEFK